MSRCHYNKDNNGDLQREFNLYNYIKLSTSFRLVEPGSGLLICYRPLIEAHL